MTGIVRFKPFEEFSSFWPRDLFGRFPMPRAQAEWNPSCDVSETEQAYIVHAELPGVEAKDMEVSIANGMLTICGEKRTETSEDKDGRTYSERFFGSFERSLTIPGGIDEERIEASLKDGVLEVQLPKTAPSEPQARKIEVKAAQ